MRVPAAVRLVHPAPALAVVVLSAALALILSAQAGGIPVERVVLVVLSVAGSQIATGALNDWADRERDIVGRPEKLIPAGKISPGTAMGVAWTGVALQVAASLPLGLVATAVGLGALASAAAYDLGVSRTPASVVPYLVSFGLLPIWVAAGLGVPIARVLPAVPLVAPFAAAAHLANTLRDWEADAAGGSRSLAQVLGRRTSRILALVLAAGVGVGAGAILISAGRLGIASTALGGVGLLAIVQGARSSRALWYGMLAAAVCWAAAWAISTA